MRRKWLIATILILILLVLCVFMVSILMNTIHQSGGWRLSLAGLPAMNTSHEAEETHDFTVGDPATLIVTNACGDIDVRSQTGERITVNAYKKAWGANQTAAEANLSKIELDLTQDGDILHVNVKNAEQICRSEIGRPSEVNFSIIAPQRTYIQAAAELGEISLEGFELAAELHTQFGDIHARDLKAELLVETENGQVKVVSVDAGNGSISLKTVFGDIHLEDSKAGTLEAATENGKISLDILDISGASHLSSSFGDLRWASGKTQLLELKTKNGQITLQDIRISSYLTATTDFGDIRLSGVEAESYQATTLNGKIEIDGAQGILKLRSGFGDITVTQADQVTFDLHSKNGNLSLQGSLGEGPHLADTDFGDIELEFPAGTPFDFDLQTNFGTIEIDSGETRDAYSIHGKPTEKHWKGEANDGGPLLTASNQNGNITILLIDNNPQ